MKTSNFHTKTDSSRASAMPQGTQIPLKTIVDNRPKALVQRKIQDAANSHSAKMYSVTTTVVQRTIGDKIKKVYKKVKSKFSSGTQNNNQPIPVNAPDKSADAFLKAYNNARFYHATYNPENVKSIEDNGLLTEASRKTKGINTEGFSSTRDDMVGDEKEGVYINERKVVPLTNETYGDPQFRVFLDKENAKEIGSLNRYSSKEKGRPKVFKPEYNENDKGLLRDQNGGGGYVSRDDIPAKQISSKPLGDLLNDEKIDDILEVIGTHYPDGERPSLQEMKQIMESIVNEEDYIDLEGQKMKRRLSNLPFDNHERSKR